MSLDKSKGRKKQKQPADRSPTIEIKERDPNEAASWRGEKDFPVAALGASAGGLEAFTRFLSKVPGDSGVAFILVQHLDPSQPSRLSELLSRESPVPVTEAIDGVMVEPDHAYVIPPGMIMSIRERTLRLQEQQEHPGLYHSIDAFFHSLADDVKERAVGIILSGTATDGTEGAEAIKAQQGLVIVQDPETAKYDGMPRAAIAAGVADYVLSPEAMPEQIMDYVRKSHFKREETRRSLRMDDASLKNILSVVRARTGRDFSGYKLSSITRRIERRMAVNQVETPENYIRLLQEQPSEIADIAKDFLIKVTSFFRDPEAFESLEKEIGKILKDKPEGSPLRAWIAGCATGEEAYSIAMLLMECAQDSGRRYDIQVFGTDLDAEAITFARAGTYSAAVARDVGEARLERVFTQTGSSYQIKKNVREKLIFAVHDLVTHPPYSRMDVVSVRNLLIYFDIGLQKKIIPLLHHSLNQGGLLFLGTAETIGEVTDLFAPVDKKWRIYRSINKEKQPTNVDFAGRPALGEASSPKLRIIQSPLRPGPDPAAALGQLLLEALPPSVLVDREFQVVYTHGNTGKYLQLPEGKPSINILQMVNPDLRIALSAALHEAAGGGNKVVSDGLRVKHDGGAQPVKITIRPLSHPVGNLTITFEDVHRRQRRKVEGGISTEARHQDLERELAVTRETLRGTIEQLETANEEMKSANEEYASANEELKSANEELETSREELQSVNEELMTVNTEYQKKNEDLATVNNDMRNLLNSTGIATVFLDEKLRIRRFTPAATQLFKFIDSDIGRPVEDITSHLKTDGLTQIARRVLDTLVPVEQQMQAVDGRWYSIRVHPYRTTDNTIEGVVASFVDVSQVKAALAYAEGIIDTVRAPMLVLDEDLKVVSASRAFYAAYKVSKGETEGQLIYELGNRQWDIPRLREMLKDVIGKNSVFDGYRVEHDFAGVGRRVILLNARRVYGGIDVKPRILLSMEDVTGRAGLEQFSERKVGKEDGGL